MDISELPLKLENDFPRTLEVLRSRQTTRTINGETKPVLRIDCYLLPRIGDIMTKSFILPIKIDLDRLVVPFEDYEECRFDVVQCLE